MEVVNEATPTKKEQEGTEAEEEVLVEHVALPPSTSPRLPPPAVTAAHEPTTVRMARPSSLVVSLAQRAVGSSPPASLVGSSQGLPSISLVRATWTASSPPSSLVLAEGSIGVVVAGFCLCGLLCAIRRSLAVCSRYRRHRLVPGSEVAAESDPRHRVRAVSAASGANGTRDAEDHDKQGAVRESGRVLQAEAEYDLD